jgi:hypothetical protein
MIMGIAEARSCVRTTVSRWVLTGAVVAVLSLLLVSSGPSPALAQTAGDSLYAVLYNGSSGYYVFMNDLKFMFKTLKDDYGYTKNNIIVLSYSGFSYDLDGDGLNDIDFSGTKANADTVFARLSRVVTQNDVVFFYATDHGTHENNPCKDAALSVYSGNPIYEEDLVTFFDRLDTPARKITKIMVFNTCYAGGMIPELSALDYPLMITSAAKECEASHYYYSPCDDDVMSCDHFAFSFHWTAAMHGSDPPGTSLANADYNNDGYIGVSEAMRFAKENDEFAQDDSSPKEHPVYWDSDCIVGQYTALDGTIPGIPGMIVFRYRCHDPLPYRWGSWRSTGGGLGWPAAGRDGAEEEIAVRGAVETVLWSDIEPSPGDTAYVYARVRNPGDSPLVGAQVTFYYSNPTVSLIYPQTGLNTIGTEYIPMLGPHDSLTVGPVPFVPPAGGNTWGEPYWTLMATAEHSASPVETGWLENDDHVAANNRFDIRAFPAELKTMHFSAHNALDVPVKAVLSVDDTDWPSGWMIQMTPAAGDSIEIEPGSSIPVELRVMGLSGVDPDGIIDIALELNTTTASECESCDDSTCGGYIGNAGGCSVKLVVEGTIGVTAPEFDISATATAITLSWEFDEAGEGTFFNVYRVEKGRGDYTRLNGAPITGSGRLVYADDTAEPGKNYLYVLGVVDGGSERMSRPIEASLAGALGFEIEQNYPNPFNPSTTIRFSLPESGDISVRIYDTAGGIVKTLFEGGQTRGVHTLHWYGENASGAEVSSGVYYCRIEMANGQARTTKLVILR